MKQLSLLQKFQLLILPLLGIAGLVGYLVFDSLKMNAQELEYALEAKAKVYKLSQILMAQKDATKALLLNPELIMELSEQKIAYFDEGKAILLSLKSQLKSQQSVEVLMKMEGLYDTLLRDRDAEVLELSFADGKAAVQKYFSIEANQDFKEFQAASLALVDIAEKNTEQAKLRMQVANKKSLDLIILVLGLGFAFFIALSCLLVISVQKKMEKLSDQMDQGTKSLLNIDRHFSQANEKLRDFASANTKQLSDASTKVEKSCLNEKELLRVLSQAHRRAETAKNLSSEGQSAVQNLELRLQEMRNLIHSVTKILEIVNSISFQTNILSLNASVEAARAGEHGKGFSVVAESVRSLARQTSQSSQDINKLLKETLGQLTHIESAMGLTHSSFLSIRSEVDVLSDEMKNVAKAGTEHLGDAELLVDGINALASHSQTLGDTSRQLENALNLMKRDFSDLNQSARLLELFVKGQNLKKAA